MLAGSNGRMIRAVLVSGIAALSCLSGLPSGKAADDQGEFALRGFGAHACADARTRIEQEPEAAQNALAWLLGYMSAVNRVQADTFDISPIVGGGPMLELLLGLCADNPDALVENVAFELLRTLSIARVPTSSPVVDVEYEGARVQLRQQTLQAMQAALIELDHLSGAADGVYGPQTRLAIQAFQESQEIPETGVPDPVTILRLLVELPRRAGDG